MKAKMQLFSFTAEHVDYVLKYLYHIKNLKFEKEFNYIAKHYEFSNLIFGKIDGMTNDIADIVNYGYPSIILFKKGYFIHN